ncbi:purine-nucleoside phosphorylase [Amaricoccus solimangrovi]|uniref:Purine nucleoside phosphorylase n=1 Tax=Amaricoccus solimangrovi TaxID=2589815 RepID=A0A501WX72_9RHOB|nr:purine-nucleoside phosphorylase [Amaricoccus solimangrovi]TPE52754.1 purine-nucleoside phosphorylase [Amaricoccus solimangrovi]
MTQAERVARARASIAARAGEPVELALILGSGLGDLADAVEGAVAIPYAEIAGMAVSTAPSHAGELVLGRLFGRRVALMRGRLHLYEGWPARDIAMPVYLMRSLGARSLVVTNAAGALNPEFRPGEVMLIEDHLNLTGANPLTGPDEPALGPRFPDMSRAYAPELRTATLDAAAAAGIALRRGIYAGIAGPSLETSAERRWLRATGADAVGMSTVIEVIAAHHAGLSVLGLSAITNSATGGPEQLPDTIEEVLAHAKVAGGEIAGLLEATFPRL